MYVFARSASGQTRLPSGASYLFLIFWTGERWLHFACVRTQRLRTDEAAVRCTHLFPNIWTGEPQRYSAPVVARSGRLPYHMLSPMYTNAM